MKINRSSAKSAEEVIKKNSVSISVNELSPEELEHVKAQWEEVRQSLPFLMVIQYRKTRLRLYLWEAVRCALKEGLSLPQEARDYLIACADALLDEEHPPTDYTKIAFALKLNGREISNFHKAQNKTPIVEAYRYKLEGFETEEKAADSIGIDPRHLRRIVQEAKKKNNKDGD